VVAIDVFPLSACVIWKGNFGYTPMIGSHKRAVMRSDVLKWDISVSEAFDKRTMYKSQKTNHLLST
jgi:hypothetical protein